MPLCLCVTVLALVTAVFVASVRNARAIRRDLTRRFDAVEARLEKQANALAAELLARTNDTTE
jgi:heme exporter protein D